MHCSFYSRHGQKSGSFDDVGVLMAFTTKMGLGATKKGEKKGKGKGNEGNVCLFVFLIIIIIKVGGKMKFKREKLGGNNARAFLTFKKYQLKLNITLYMTFFSCQLNINYIDIYKTSSTDEHEKV